VSARATATSHLTAEQVEALRVLLGRPKRRPRGVAFTSESGRHAVLARHQRRRADLERLAAEVDEKWPGLEPQARRVMAETLLKAETDALRESP